MLSNPIGLITADEVVMGGGFDIKQSYLYLEGEQDIWTATPYYYCDTDGEYLFSFDEFLYGEELFDFDSWVRPVINLKADVSFTGDGSYDNPYVIITE